MDEILHRLRNPRMIGSPVNTNKHCVFSFAEVFASRPGKTRVSRLAHQLRHAPPVPRPPLPSAEHGAEASPRVAGGVRKPMHPVHPYCGWTQSCTTWKPWDTIFIGIYRGIIMSGFLGWCRISSIHSRSSSREGYQLFAAV